MNSIPYEELDIIRQIISKANNKRYGDTLDSLRDDCKETHTNKKRRINEQRREGEISAIFENIVNNEMYNNKDDSMNINRNTISRNVHDDEEIISNNDCDLDTVDGELFSELDHKEIYGRDSIENATTTHSTIGLPEFVSLDSDLEDIDSASEEASNRRIL